MIYTQNSYDTKTAIPKKAKGLTQLVAKKVLLEKTKGGEMVRVTTWEVADLDDELLSRIPTIERHLKNMNDFALFYGARLRPTERISRDKLNDPGTRARLIAWANGRPRRINGIIYDETEIIEEWTRNADFIKNGNTSIDFFARNVIEWHKTTDFNEKIEFLFNQWKRNNLFYGMQYANGGRYVENPDIVFSIILGRIVQTKEDYVRAMEDLSIDRGLQKVLLEVYDRLQARLVEYLATYELYRTEDFNSLKEFTEKEKKYAVDEYFFTYDHYHAKTRKKTKSDRKETNEVWENNRIDLTIEWDNHQVKSNVMKSIGIPSEYIITPKKRKIDNQGDIKNDGQKTGRYSYPREAQRTFPLQTELFNDLTPIPLYEDKNVSLVVGKKDQSGNIIARNDFVLANYRNVEDFKLTKKVIQMITSSQEFDAEAIQDAIDEAVNSTNPREALDDVQANKLRFRFNLRELSTFLHPTMGAKSATINSLIDRFNRIPWETYIFHRDDGELVLFGSKDFVLMNVSARTSKPGVYTSIICSPSLFDRISDNYIPMDDNYMRLLGTFRDNDKISPATLIILELEWKKVHANARTASKAQKKEGMKLLDKDGNVVKDIDGNDKTRKATKKELQKVEDNNLVSFISIPNFINAVMINCGVSYEDSQKKTNRQKYANKIKEIVEKAKNEGVLIRNYTITKDKNGDTSFQIWWQ